MYPVLAGFYFPPKLLESFFDRHSVFDSPRLTQTLRCQMEDNCASGIKREYHCTCLLPKKKIIAKQRAGIVFSDNLALEIKSHDDVIRKRLGTVQWKMSGKASG
ncbi:hypothetical protein Btru_069197 [Bulinus truncatus]|nr:hypothetical protein Btru_069197 [Bulinus truncatus]